MKDNFPKIVSETLQQEGGYVNDPQDPGGETNMGISKRAYPDVDIKNLTKAQAIDIYHRDYWNKVKGDDLPSGLDMVVFDSAVNSGISKATKWLQNALGVPVDGVLGPQTMKALVGKNTGPLIDTYLDTRLAFLKQLPTWGRYKKGWSRRVSELRNLAHAFK